MTVNLGQELSTQTPSRDQLVFQSDIDRLIARGLSDLETRLRQYISGRMPPPPRDPVVNVTVPTPAVNNAFAPSFSPNFQPLVDVEVEVPGIDKLVTEMALLRTALAAHMDMMSRPVTRRVVRDEDGLIERVVDTR